MVAVAISNFRGQAPRLDPHLLGNAQSAGCTNVDLRTGALRPLRSPVTTVPAATTDGVYLASGARTAAKRLFRLLTSIGGTQWWLSPDPMASLLRSPTSNDSFDRVYWTEAGSVPKVNTMARLATNSAAYPLGLATPPTPSVGHTGGSASNVTRAYVYTYITSLGEEGPPSAPDLHTGPSDATWTITGYPTTNPDGSRPITGIRIYRSEIDTGRMRFVSEQLFTISGTTNDTLSETALALRSQLVSTGWVAPVAGLTGLVAHPNGFFAGFLDRNVYFSEPYLPHAWPVGYSLRVQSPIVALAVIGDSIAVLTKGQPVVLTGSSPLTMSPETLGQPSPCLAARSVVVDGDFVYYATIDGIARLSVRGVEVVSDPFITRETWSVSWYHPDMRAVLWGGQYMALTAPGRGFLFSPAPPTDGFVQISLPRDRQGVDVGFDTGEIYMLRNGDIERWMPSDSATGWLNWTWTSKTYLFPKPLNLGAVQCKLLSENYEEDVSPEQGGVDQLRQTAMLAYNQARLDAGPLDVLAAYVVAGEIVVTGLTLPSGEVVPPLQPVGGEPLYEPFRSEGLTLRVYTRGKLVFEDEIDGEHTRRLPSEIKGSRWYFELSGNRSILALHVAETGKELANV